MARIDIAYRVAEKTGRTRRDEQHDEERSTCYEEVEPGVLLIALDKGIIHEI